MQLRKQCTWISLNLTMISNQARRWVECSLAQSMPQVFKCARVKPPKAGHLLSISSLKELAIGHFHWAEIGAPDATKWAQDARPPASGALGLATCSSLNLERQTLTVTYGPPDATKWPPDTSGTHRSRAQRVCQTMTSPDWEHQTVRCSPDLCAERVAKPPHTGQTPPDALRASGALSQAPST